MMAPEEKEQQSLYLRESIISALRQIAEGMGSSISAVADEFLEDQIRQFRSTTRTLRSVKLLEENLPDSLTDVDDDHPVFGRKKPKVVVTELRHGLRHVPRR